MTLLEFCSLGFVLGALFGGGFGILAALLVKVTHPRCQCAGNRPLHR